MKQPAPAPHWSRLQWFLVVAVLTGVQASVLLEFARWPVLPPARPPRLESLSLRLGEPVSLVGPLGNWTADPRQFALPDRAGFSGVAQRALPVPEYRLAEWSARPRWLPATAQPERLGSAPTRPNLPVSTHAEPSWARAPENISTPLVLPGKTTTYLRGSLHGRSFSSPTELSAALSPDVLSATVVELSVSAGGEVMLTRLISSSGNREADVKALNWARSLYFEPTMPEPSPSASDPTAWTTGELVVVWHVQPSLR